MTQYLPETIEHLKKSASALNICPLSTPLLPMWGKYCRHYFQIQTKCKTKLRGENVLSSVKSTPILTPVSTYCVQGTVLSTLRYYLTLSSRNPPSRRRHWNTKWRRHMPKGTQQVTEPRSSPGMCSKTPLASQNVKWQKAGSNLGGIS